MATKTNVDWYRERLQVLEQEFGAKWLKKKARDPSFSHPIPRLWASATAMLDAAAHSRAMGMTLDLAWLFDLCTDLEFARRLPGYSSAITPEHLKRLTFEKECYVAHVAAKGVRSGYSVSFVPVSERSGERTPDLRMTLGEQTLDVECKRKDAYNLDEERTDAWQNLESTLNNMQEQLSCDYEVLVCAIGALPSWSVENIARFVRERVSAGDEGEFFGEVPDCVVIIKRSPERPDGVDGIWIPDWQNPVMATATFHVDKNGTINQGPMLRLSLYIIDAHRLSQVLSSFRSAHGQIDPDGAGMIFIGVDTSNVRSGDHELYFQTIARWMSRQFTPKQHTRIAAVVLTGDIATVEITANKGWHRTSRHWWEVKNPYYPEIDSVLIPGNHLETGETEAR